MRINPNRIYPYPVYSELTDDYRCQGFSADVDMDYDSETATLSISPLVADERIINLLENDIIALYCHVDCSVTKYRELFPIQYDREVPSYNISIPLYKLNDTVEVLCALVAKEDITDFTDENFSQMYEGDKVSFPKYATIGYTATTELVLTKRVDTKGELPSIFAFNKSETDKSLTYDFTGDQIVVFLPAKEFQTYFDYVGQGVRLKQMMTVFPVLIDVINAVKADTDSLDGRPWFSVLEAAFKKNGFHGFDDDSFISTDAVTLAQKILGELCKDAFDEFDKMNRDKE